MVMRRASHIVLDTLILLILAQQGFAQSAPPAQSLFLTPDEEARAASDHTPYGTAALRDPADLTLDALIYYAPDHWSLWLQGEPWTPTTRHTNIRILSVSENDVRLSYRPDPRYPAREIKLHPHQTYHIADDSVR